MKRIRLVKDSLLLGALTVFVLRGLGAAFALLFNVAVARLIGAEGAGHYYFALSLTMTLSVFARLGLDNSLLRFVATSSAAEEWGRVRGLFALGLRQCLIASVVLAVGLALLAAPLASRAFGDDGASVLHLLFMAAAIITSSLMMLIGESLKGLGRITGSMLVSGVLYPVFALALIWPAVTLVGESGASLAYLAGTGAAAATGLWMWHRSLASHPAPAEAFPPDQLRASSRPLLLVSLVNGPLLAWLPVFYVAFFVTTAETGIMAAALRVASVLAFFSAAVQTAISPTISILAARQTGTEALQAAVSRATTLVVLSLLPVCLGLVVFAELIMASFGSEFREGAGLLVLLALANLVMSLAGPGGFVLALSGNERAASRVALLTALVATVFIGVLTPLFGTIGAVLGIGIAMVADKWLCARQVRRLMGIDCFVTPATLKQGLGGLRDGDRGQ